MPRLDRVKKMENKPSGSEVAENEHNQPSEKSDSTQSQSDSTQSQTEAMSAVEKGAETADEGTKQRNEEFEKLRSEIATLRKSVEEKESIIKDYESLLKKIQADFDNYRKRIEREREEYSKLVVERLVRKLVNVIDDLDRGLSETKVNGNGDPFRAGIEKIRENTMQILTEEGLREIPTNKPFDPYYHEALVVEESSDYGDNEIMEVYQKGYTLGTKVIRPAKVRVSRKVERKESGDETEKDV